jgi:tetratricopeptide (TPR) repeat protein
VSAPVAEDVDEDEVADEDDENDNDGNDDNEEGTNEEEEMQTKLKQEFDSYSSMATKLMKGNKFNAAAEKYSEAIKLIAKHSYLGGNKDLIALYNNRSAMYEKVSAYQQSLEDIILVLTLDPLHIKARLRRSRIYEAQGKMKESIGDYMTAIVIEQTKGETTPQTNMDKVEQMCSVTARQVHMQHAYSYQQLHIIVCYTFVYVGDARIFAELYRH